MSYSLHITASAERDIINASDYIEFTLKNPQAADNLLDSFESKINSLADFPNRNPLVDDPVLSSWNIRFITINGYLAFYIVFKEKKLVTIVRVLYHKSNWPAILKQGFSLV